MIRYVQKRKKRIFILQNREKPNEQQDINSKRFQIYNNENLIMYVHVCKSLFPSLQEAMDLLECFNCATENGPLRDNVV